jgi:hypothetical protein
MNTKSVAAILSAMAMVGLIVSPSSTGNAAALGSQFSHKHGTIHNGGRPGERFDKGNNYVRRLRHT